MSCAPPRRLNSSLPAVCQLSSRHEAPGVQAGAMTGFVAAFTEGPIDFYKSQVQVQIIRSKGDPNYKRAPRFH